jgi:hypothetical protein
MRGLISFSLWGNSPQYLIGAKKNVTLAKTFYPGWDIRIAISSKAEYDLSFIDELVSDGAQVILKAVDYNDYRNLFWRMEACCDEEYTHVIVRDTDSRLNKREAAAVNEWTRSGFPFHIMRDHMRFHNARIMGGMFGACPGGSGLLVGDRHAFSHSIMGQYLSGIDAYDTPLGCCWGADQDFLSKVIWPIVKENHIAHDDSRRKTRNERKFKVNLKYGHFVGMRYNENDVPEIV